MKLTWNSLSVLIILVLCGIIFFLQECRKGCPVMPAAITDTQYVKIHDTVTKEKLVPYEVIKEGKPYPVTVTDTEFLTVTQAVDTPAILRDYFVTRFYIDTSKTKYGTLFIRDSVTQNRIKYRQVLAEWNIPEVHTVQPAPLRNQVYAGFSIGADGQYLGFGPDVTLLTKRQHIYGLGADFIPGKPIFYRVKTAWLIHIPKIKLW